MTLHFILALGEGRSLPALGFAALLTYLLHSVIWCGAAALLVRTRMFSPSAQSYLWLAALLGPLLTSAIATGASSSAPHFSIATETVPPAPSGVVGAVDHDPPMSGSVLSGVLLALVAAAALGGAQFTLALLALRRRLRDRAPLDDLRILERSDRLRTGSALRHVRLTQSAAIDVPLVLGRSEICLPLGSLSDASDAEIDAVLAHELAHILRRDGVVFPLVGLVQAIGWLHPIHHWVAARFRQAAELACDDRAVELTGDRLALAQALARVAQDAIGVTRAPMLPAMARPRAASALLVRVRRLVGAPARASAAAGWAAACCAALAILTVSVSVRAARPPLPRPAAFEERAAATPATATDEIADLMERAEQLEREIAALQQSAAAGDGESESSILELQQQLRHVRETAGWIERKSSGQVRP